MEFLYTLLICIAIFIVFIVVFTFLMIKRNKKQLKTEECKRDGERWLRLMKLYYSPNSRKLEEQAIAEGAKSQNDCANLAREIEKKYESNAEIPLAWGDAELVKLMDDSTFIIPSVLNQSASPATNSSDEFNTKGAIIGGMLGGVTGAYIGGHIKKKDEDKK